MTRRLLGMLVLAFLLPMAGAGRLGWFILRTVARPRIVMTLAGLGVALSTSPTLMAAQFPTEEIRSLGHMISPWVVSLGGVVVCVSGARSRWVRRVRRRLLSR